MRIAYLDCFSGISGDMMLGALVHAGVEPELFRRTIAALGLDARIEVRQVDRSGIASLKVDVITPGADHDHAHLVLGAEHHHHDGRDHNHPHGQPQVQGDEQQDHSPDHGRSLAEITALISRATIPSHARELALRAFQLLGAAEARIHNIPLEKVHFHEIGALDAIVDIVCCAAGCDSLGAGRWLCSPVNVGGGTVQCAHGIFPVPAPATAELLKGAPTYSSGAQAELATPTGAALLRGLNVDFVEMPEMTVDRIGYGAGARDPRGYANVLRLSLGEAREANLSSDVVTVIETAVDDLTPEIIGYVTEQALTAGALDAMVAPVQMKKNRPGHLITLLCRPEDASRISELLLRETSTLGVRWRQERRRIMDRHLESVRTPWGEVRVKLGYSNGRLANCAPEFDDCRRIAQEHGIPLKAVMQEAVRLAGRERHADGK